MAPRCRPILTTTPATSSLMCAPVLEPSAATTLREYIWLPANDNTPASGNDTYAETMGLAANDNAPPDLPLAVVNVAATPTIFQVHTDHLGRPIRLTDAAKATVWQATYKPWGAVHATSGTQAQNLRFPGQYFQIETGLAYNWHRQYDPVTGRFTQPDPLRFIDGPSMYAYAGSSPFMKTDREGLKYNGIPTGSPTAEDAQRGQQCAQSCLESNFGLTAAAGGSLLGATPVPKKWLGVPVLPKSSRVTNPISLGVPGKLPFGGKVLGTRRLGGALGRGNAIAAPLICLVDILSISACTKACMGK
jgi:RHS repeat-associated protein